MARTIAGVFDTRERGDQVRDELIRAGIPAGDVRVGMSSDVKTTVPETGFWEKVREFFGMYDMADYEEAERRGHVVVTAHVPDDRIDQAVGIMEAHGAIDIDESAKAWQAAGWQRPERDESALGAMSGTERAEPARTSEPARDETVIPVVEERLKVGTRREQRKGVRVYSHVVETPVEEEVRLREEHAHVERRPADRPASPQAFEEKTIEVTEVREEPVVSKEARVVEEVVVSKEAVERPAKVRETVRKTKVDVEKAGEQTEDEMRRDFERSFANRGLTYDQFQPAYEYGRDLAREDRFRGKEWTTIEPEAQRNFEQRHVGRWDTLKEAVKHGYERVRGQTVSR